jgi:hypothetical protein
MKLVKSTDGIHKWVAEFDDGTQTRFGAAGMDDYTITKDEKRRTLYLIRHAKNENWRDPKSAGALSRWILWNLPTIEASLRDYRRRFPNV